MTGGGVGDCNTFWNNVMINTDNLKNWFDQLTNDNELKEQIQHGLELVIKGECCQNTFDFLAQLDNEQQKEFYRIVQSLPVQKCQCWMPKE